MAAIRSILVGAGLTLVSLTVGTYLGTQLELPAQSQASTAAPTAADPIVPSVEVDDPLDVAPIVEPDEDPPYSTREAAPAAGAWQRSSGKVPSVDDPSLESHPTIRILSDEDFNPAQGIRSGNGTWENPYVISGLSVSSITIKDTDAYVVLQENYVKGTMVLDWNGDRTNVHHNHIGDLRVNQNVKRTGDATSGIIADNVIGRVGQLRHYDGEFAYNHVLGINSSPIPGFGSVLAVNVDGFNGARFHHNVVNGVVDVRLHGHHHGSGFATESHDHADPENGYDHTVRYHEVSIEDNEITAWGRYALRYFDQAHSANDRTANSEPEKDLNDPHVHYLKVDMLRNTLHGGGIFLDIVNAEDPKHTTDPCEASIRVDDNRVVLRNPEDGPNPTTNVLSPPRSGIEARLARGAEITFNGNSVDNQVRPLPGMSNTTAGIRLENIGDTEVIITDNKVHGTLYGVWARTMDETVEWWIWSNGWTEVKNAIWYDSTVKNKPHEEPKE